MTKIIINNIEYDYETLPENAKKWIVISEGWKEELELARINVMKIEAALQGVAFEIERLVTENKKPT